MAAALDIAQPNSGATATSHGTLVRCWMTLGAISVVTGGLVAALTGPLALWKGSWLAAYLVLVCGVPQHLMGRVATRWNAVRAGWFVLAMWNAGNIAVIAGTLLAAPYLVDAGGAFLLVVLIALLRTLLRRQPSDAIVLSHGVWRWLVIALLSALIVSVPIGLVLAHLRAG
jgi:hypothetical protein